MQIRPPIKISCTIDGSNVQGADVIRQHVCTDIVAELNSRMRVETAPAVQPASRAGTWAHFEIRIVSRQTIKATASWGRDGKIHGRAQELTAGIDDAPINRGLAQALARGLASQVPTSF